MDHTPSHLEAAHRFMALHAGPGLFVMPNAWDAGSARLLAAEGFKAIATTSAGIAFSMGLPDQHGAVPRDVQVGRCAEIASAVALPVSADLEDGYGAHPETVAETITAAIAAGLCGANIEDFASTGPAAGTDHGFYPLPEAVARIRAARAAADATGLPFVLTGRSDVLLHNHPGGLAEAIRRCNAYREAGADCLFAPGMADADTISRFVAAVDGPVTVVMGLAGAPLSVAQLADLGVRRVSIGGSLARACLGLVRSAAREIIRDGTFSYAAGQIPDPELVRFFAGDGSW